MTGPEKKNEYKVGALAALANVGLGTVRHYQKLGLLPIPSRPAYGGARKYSQAELSRLLLIKNAQSLGFSLKEIAEILHHQQQQDCLRVKQICLVKQQELEKQIRAYEIRQMSLKAIVDCCSGPCHERSCALVHGLCRLHGNWHEEPLPEGCA